jgi:hypothetical protein
LPSGWESVALNDAVIFNKMVPEGTSTQVFLVAGADGTLKKGSFYKDMKEKHNLPNWANDESTAKALWEKSEELVSE